MESKGSSLRQKNLHILASVKVYINISTFTCVSELASIEVFNHIFYVHFFAPRVLYVLPFLSLILSS
jgi:hypothetical protein